LVRGAVKKDEKNQKSGGRSARRDQGKPRKEATKCFHFVGGLEGQMAQKKNKTKKKIKASHSTEKNSCQDQNQKDKKRKKGAVGKRTSARG